MGKFTWPMPKVKDIFSKLNGAKYFTTLDLRAGYHHIPLDKLSIPTTAFNSPFGKYEYIKVPFGLAQVPAYFQELKTGIQKEINFTIAYLDNIIIFSKTPEGIQKTPFSKTFNETQQVSFFLQRNSVFRTHFEHQRDLTTTIKDTNHSTNAAIHFS